MAQRPGWRPNRRRALQIIGCAAASMLMPLGAGARAALRKSHWRGEVMGAIASIDLVSGDIARSDRLIADILREVRRLENLFSLHKPGAAIAALNAEGFLDDADEDFFHLLRLAQGVHETTAGAFDVSIQPLWRLYADHFSSPNADPAGPGANLIESAAQLVDGRAIGIADKQVRFAKPGMSITLNGIAQGYISDRVARRLKAEGVEHVLVDMGEIVAIGRDEDARPWRIGLLDGRRPMEISEIIELEGMAVATSGGYGMSFDAEGRFHHLIDPRTARSAARNLAVTVTAASATLADALSTGFSAMDETEIEATLRHHPGVGVHLTRLDGTVAIFGSFPKRHPA